MKLAVIQELKRHLEMRLGGLIPSKPRPSMPPSQYRIDDIVNLTRAQLKRRLIAFGSEMP